MLFSMSFWLNKCSLCDHKRLKILTNPNFWMALFINHVKDNLIPRDSNFDILNNVNMFCHIAFYFAQKILKERLYSTFFLSSAQTLTFLYLMSHWFSVLVLSIWSRGAGSRQGLCLCEWVAFWIWIHIHTSRPSYWPGMLDCFILLFYFHLRLLTLLQ